MPPARLEPGRIPDEPPEQVAAAPTGRRLLRYAPLAVLAAVAAAAWWSGLPGLMAPAAIGREYAQLQAIAAGAPVLAVGGFVLTYAVLTGSCLPTPLMMSLMGGAVFGVWVAAPAVLIGGTGGALLTYAATRSAFAPFLLERARRDPRLQGVIAGFGRSAFSYILTLRLIPMVPFAVVNVASGIAAAPMRPFLLATLVGGVPTAFVYTGLGAGLGAAIGSQESITASLRSPGLLAPLAGLGLLALAAPLAKALRSRARRRRDRP